MAEELKALNLALKDKNQELMAANKKLQGLDKLKSDFLSMATHELKTPLSIIRGYNRMLLSESVGSLNDKQREYLSECKESCDRLINLINTMLDLSKIEAGKIEINRLPDNLAYCIDETCRNMQHLFQKKQLTLSREFDHDIPIFPFDRERISQVMMNLLGNALKFTMPPGKVTIAVSTLSQKELSGLRVFEEEKRHTLDSVNGTYVLVSVKDTGIGISKEQQKLVFMEFKQFARSGDKKEGTGLGLAICKKIIESHGGRIWVESSENQGSNFSYILPM
jgi:Amt family ammonium transporter